jgi:hypothetical protein
MSLRKAQRRSNPGRTVARYRVHPLDRALAPGVTGIASPLRFSQ